MVVRVLMVEYYITKFQPPLGNEPHWLDDYITGWLFKVTKVIAVVTEGTRTLVESCSSVPRGSIFMEEE